MTAIFTCVLLSIMSAIRFSGVVTPVLTPFNKDGSVAEDLYFEHCRQMLAEGSDYLSPFGTTGEALSVSVAERRDLLEKLVSEGVAKANQLMPGTGLCSLADTVELTQHAQQLGCAAVMTLPPFFYPGPPDDGLFNYFAALVEATGADSPRICLYHIPQNTNVGFSPKLAARLNTTFPETIVAYKDSSGVWDNTAAVIADAPGLSVFPASESSLVKAIPLGAAGCISATCNVNVGQIKRVFEKLQSAGDGEQGADLDDELPRLDRIRESIQTAGLIPALKSIRAALSKEPRWLNLRAPMISADPEVGKNLVAKLELSS